MRDARASMSGVSSFKFQVSSFRFHASSLKFHLLQGPTSGTLDLKPETRNLKLAYLTSKYSIAFSFQLPPTRARM